MWIRAQDGVLHNCRYLTSLRVCESSSFRARPHGTGYISYGGAPKSGYVVVAWGRDDFPIFLTSGLDRAKAEAILAGICQALAGGEKLIDLSQLEAA